MRDKGIQAAPASHIKIENIMNLLSPSLPFTLLKFILTKIEDALRKMGLTLLVFFPHIHPLVHWFHFETLYLIKCDRQLKKCCARIESFVAMQAH